MLYFDERNVSRIYEMTFSNGIWKLWRNIPVFSQRFSGIIKTMEILLKKFGTFVKVISTERKT